MPVLELECQLARSQISRYMSGEVISAESLRQLGGHVAECVGCRVFLEERRETLRSMLPTETGAAIAEAEASTKKAPARRRTESPTNSNYAVVDAETAAPTASPRNAFLRVLKQQLEKPDLNAPAETAQAVANPQGKSVKPMLTKPLLYALGLAGVLVGMTYMVKNPNGPLGAKASDLFASTSSQATNQAKVASDPKSPPANPPTKPADSATSNQPPKGQSQSEGAAPSIGSASSQKAINSAESDPAVKKSATTSTLTPPDSQTPADLTTGTSGAQQTPQTNQTQPQPIEPKADQSKPAVATKPKQTNSKTAIPASAPKSSKARTLKRHLAKSGRRRSRRVALRKATKIRHRSSARVRIYDPSGHPLSSF